MRISMRKSDRGFSPKARKAKVLFNGVDCPCITADEEIGEVLRYKRDGAGNVVFTTIVEEKRVPATEWVKGKVKINLDVFE